MRVIILFVLAALWSSHVVLSKILGLHDFAQIMAVLILYLIGTAVLMTILLFIRQRKLPSFRSAGVFFLITGFVGYLLPLMVELKVMPHIPVTVFLFVGTLVSVVTLLLTWVLRLETVGYKRVLGAVFGLAAVITLLGNPFSGADQWNIWYLIAFIMPLSYGSADIYIERRWPKGFSLLQVSSGDAIVALGYAIIIAAFVGTTPNMVVTVATTHSWLILGLVASTMLSSLIFFAVVRTSGAVFVSFTTFVTLVMGIFVDWWIFDDPLSKNAPYAVSLLIISLLLLHYGTNGRAKKNSN